MNKIVVYLIKENGIVKYVGQTNDFKRRKREHLGSFGHTAIPIDVDLSTIEITPVEEFDDETDALKCEDELICKYQTIENGWNERRSGLISFDHEYKLEKYRKTNQKRIKTPEYQEYRRNYLKEYNKTYYQTPQHKEYDRKYKQSEKYKEYMREYRKAHREHDRERLRLWRLKKKQEKQNETTIIQ